MVSNQNMSTLGFNKVVPVRYHSCDYPIDVPQLGYWVLYSDMISNVETGEFLCMLVIDLFCIFTSSLCLPICFFGQLLPLLYK